MDSVVTVVVVLGALFFVSFAAVFAAVQVNGALTFASWSVTFM